jgi:hypothetical protein
MTITLHWWSVPLVLFLIPIFYAASYKRTGDYDFMLGPMLVFAICWPSAIAIVVTKLFF